MLPLVSPAVAVQGAVDSAIGGEVHHHLRVVVDLQKRQSVLVGMHMSNRTEVGRTAIDVGEIDESVRRQLPPQARRRSW